MAYQVIARKWRPQSFQELVGQEHISTTLLNALRHDRLPQALLFTGVRGTGKTSSARILAKSLRCPNAVDFVPCGTCPSCLDIASGRSLDVIEIDGASNNGVDAVRELRETVGYMPSSGRYKIYIIDEVHMLSTSAFNALLKTLEEPPPHVVFIMATTEVQKIPNTILSRCQRFDFRRIPSRQIAAQLEKICTADGVATEPQALWMLARQADGSMRDSQSLLDQVITFCHGKVTLVKVVEVLGLTDRTVLLETLTALVERNSQGIIDVIEKIFSAGYDPKIFAQDLLEEIRHALMVRMVPTDPTRLVDLPDTEIENLRQLTKNLSNEDLHMLFDMTLKGVSDLLRSQDPRLVLEMLMLRMAAAPRIASLLALATGQIQLSPSQLNAQRAAVAPNRGVVGAITPSQHPAQQATTSTTSAATTSAPTLTTAPPSAPAQGSAAMSTVNSEDKPKYSMTSFVRPATGRTEIHTGGINTPLPVATPKAAVSEASFEEQAQTRILTAARAADPWFKFVEGVKKSNSLLGAMLENTHLIENEGSSIKIGVPKKTSFLFDKIREPENLKRIEAFLETFWGKSYTVQVFLADQKVEKTQATPKAVHEQANLASKKSLENAVEQNSLVQAAQNVFKTQIKSIKDAGKEATTTVAQKPNGNGSN